MSLGFLEQTTLVVVEGGVFSKDGVVGEVSELTSTAHGDAFFVGAATGESEELHGAALVYWDLLWIFRSQREPCGEQVIVTDHKDLNTLIGEALECFSELHNHLRVEVGLRLVPKKEAILSKGAIDD